ncbi:hypothetical protein, partial [Pseudomonas sp.]|uniref:hypothetical protein n=1 Tax=Pseudomonas sp. TaxID=306 RepID=UPI003FD8F85E
RAAQGVSVMRNDPCLKKTRIKSRSDGIAQVRLSEILVRTFPMQIAIKENEHVSSRGQKSDAP